MTKKDMFDALLKGEKPAGRVLFRPILMHFAARLAGNSYGEFASDYRNLVRANLLALEKFDMDMAGLISDPYRETSAFGAPVRFIPDGVPVCEKIIVTSASEARSLKNPDVYRSERTADRIRAATLLSRELKGEVPLIGWIEGPLAEACDLAGVSAMLIALMTDPDFCRILIDKCMITAKDFARAQIEAGCDIIGIGDSICSQIDPATYDAFVLENHHRDHPLHPFAWGEGQTSYLRGYHTSSSLAGKDRHRYPGPRLAGGYHRSPENHGRKNRTVRQHQPGYHPGGDAGKTLLLGQGPDGPVWWGTLYPVGRM